MRTNRVVVDSPLFYQHLRFLQPVEDFSIQQFISQLVIEAFVVAVLPGVTGLDKQCSDLVPCQPVTDGSGPESGPIV